MERSILNLDEVTVALRENERMIITLNVDDEDNAIAVVESEQGRNHSRKHNERRERLKSQLHPQGDMSNLQ